jgi:hypothetical protein
MKNIFAFGWENLLAWTAAFCLFEPISYFLIPALIKSKTVQEYYDIYRTPVAMVVFGDYIYSTFLFIVAMAVIAAVWGTPESLTMKEWIINFLTFVGVQWTGDLTFYAIVSNLPAVGKYIDFFQRYGSEVSVGAPIGDSIYGLFWFLLTQLVRGTAPLWSQVAAIVLFMFGTLVLSY